MSNIQPFWILYIIGLLLALLLLNTGTRWFRQRHIRRAKKAFNKTLKLTLSSCEKVGIPLTNYHRVFAHHKQAAINYADYLPEASRNELLTILNRYEQWVTQAQAEAEYKESDEATLKKINPSLHLRKLLKYGKP